jgi:pimeloyl-ACP methyl ester carboxylesterase
MYPLFHLLFDQGQSPEEIKEERPELGGLLDQLVPDGRTFAGRTLEFFTELNAYNFGELWGNVDCPVMVFYGESDFVAERHDHPLIAGYVTAGGGEAQFVELAETDHALRKVATKRQSQATWGQAGEYNPLTQRTLLDWIQEIQSNVGRG